MILLIGLYPNEYKTNGSLDMKAQSVFIENSQEHYQIEVPRSRLSFQIIWDDTLTSDI